MEHEEEMELVAVRADQLHVVLQNMIKHMQSLEEGINEIIKTIEIDKNNWL